MAPFDRPCATFYWSAIVGIALSCTISSYLTSNNIVTLKCRLGSRKVIKMAPFESLSYDFLLVFHSNYVSILYHFGDKARSHSMIPLGVPLVILANRLVR